MNKTTVFTLIIIILILAGVFYLSSTGERAVVTNFEECAAAGNPVMESFPRQCRALDGTIYVEEVEQPGSGVVIPPPSNSGCYVGGCSGQICSEDPDAVSTCEFREEYACYQGATCERQASGECGWTQTPSLVACLDAARN